MKIKDIKLLNFRNYDNLYLEFSDTVNVIIGNNGVGKTNILESIYVLSLTKSNRYGNESDLIKFNKSGFSIEGKIINDDLMKKLSVTLKNNKKIVSVNNKEIRKIVDYIANFSVISFSPADLEIIKGAPSVRRNFLNISLSQIYCTYIDVLNEYNAILKMRNEYLKNLNLNGTFDERYLGVINEKLVEKGCRIYECRSSYLNEVNERIENIFYKLTGIHSLRVVFDNSLGFEKYDDERIEKLFNIKLKKNYRQELILGNTLVGPHRDDLIFTLDNTDMKVYSSQGQQRMAIISFKIAELYIFKKYKNSYPVLLLDDIFSELDTKKRNRIIKYLNKEIQTIITTTDVNDINDDLLKEAKIFNIRNDKITIKGGIKNGRRKSNGKV